MLRRLRRKIMSVSIVNRQLICYISTSGMKAREFTKLTKEEKLRWLYFQGEHLTDIRYYQYKVILYVVESFLVEVFYHNSKSYIEKIEVLSGKNSRLKFYADQIKLTDKIL